MPALQVPDERDVLGDVGDHEEGVDVVAVERRVHELETLVEQGAKVGLSADDGVLEKKVFDPSGQ